MKFVKGKNKAEFKGTKDDLQKSLAVNDFPGIFKNKRKIVNTYIVIVTHPRPSTAQLDTKEMDLQLHLPYEIKNMDSKEPCRPARRFIGNDRKRLKLDDSIPSPIYNGPFADLACFNVDLEGNKKERQRHLATFAFPTCQDVSKYKKIAKIGQGTYGEVFKARHEKDGKIVALKRIMNNADPLEGFPITSIREIETLKLLKHENVINLREVCRSRPVGMGYVSSSTYLVFDFCDHDLAGLICKVKLSLADIKSVMQQLLNGLFVLYTKKVMHRDVKPANILLTKEGIVKLADFGLARIATAKRKDRPRNFTNKVVTLYYRAPELLLGDTEYNCSIDMWSAGCVMVEMFTGKPIFKGSSDQNMLSIISLLCGSITPTVWPDVEELELFKKLHLPSRLPRMIQDRLKVSVKDPLALEILDRMLTLDPIKRITANAALDHDFFWTDPMPSNLGVLLKNYNQSMFEYKGLPRVLPENPGPAIGPKRVLAPASGVIRGPGPGFLSQKPLIQRRNEETCFNSRIF